MQNLVVSLPTQALQAPLPANAGSDAGAIAAGDFAALLLGQLAVPLDVEGAALPPVTDTAEEATTEGGITDPALLLAALGLSLEPQQQPKPAGAALAGDALPDASDLSLATPKGKAQAPAEPLMSNLNSSRLGAGATGDALSPAAALIGDPASRTQPAKIAGFEQVLAEAASNAPAEASSSSLAAHSGPQAAPRTVAETAQHVATPLRDSAWPAEFGQKLVWMATQDKQSAQITLNPPQMGPIEISLSVKNDQATAIFVSSNAEVREAIESAMPRLREMLAGVGVELGQANVSAESFRQQQNPNDGKPASGDSRQLAADETTGIAGQGEMVLSPRPRHGNGLVDTFV